MTIPITSLSPHTVPFLTLKPGLGLIRNKTKTKFSVSFSSKELQIPRMMSDIEFHLSWGQ